jgi:hypothetical protein
MENKELYNYYLTPKGSHSLFFLYQKNELKEAYEVVNLLKKNLNLLNEEVTNPYFKKENKKTLIQKLKGNNEVYKIKEDIVRGLIVKKERSLFIIKGAYRSYVYKNQKNYLFEKAENYNIKDLTVFNCDDYLALLDAKKSRNFSNLSSKQKDLLNILSNNKHELTSNISYEQDFVKDSMDKTTLLENPQKFNSNSQVIDNPAIKEDDKTLKEALEYIIKIPTDPKISKIINETYNNLLPECKKIDNEEQKDKNPSKRKEHMQELIKYFTSIVSSNKITTDDKYNRLTKLKEDYKHDLKSRSKQNENEL